MSSTNVLEKFGELKRRMNGMAFQMFRPLGIGPSQAILLRFIARVGRISPSDFVRECGMDAPAVGRMIDALVARGWVERTAHESDRRRWEVTLTPEGERNLRDVQRVHTKLARRLVAPLTAAEVDTFFAILDKMIAGVGPPEATDEPPPRNVPRAGKAAPRAHSADGGTHVAKRRAVSRADR